MRKWLLISIVWACVALAATAAAKSYTVPRIHIDAKTTGDGLLLIEETLTYRFDGSFSFAYRDIPLKRGETVSDIVVSENGTTYRNESGENPSTFYTDQRGSDLRVTWYYQARNETRTFKLTYTLAGVVKRHNDVAELYFQFVGDKWDRSIGEVTVRVHPPSGVAASDVRAWAHGPLHGTVEIVAGGGVNLDVRPLPPRTFWEARILYPPDVFPGIAQSRTDARPRIVAEERVWVEEANRRRESQQRRRAAWLEKKAKQRELAGQLGPIGGLFGILGLAMWFALFRKYGKAYDVRSRSAPGEIPSDHPPAVVSYLALSRNVAGSAIVATLLDLASRGYLEIEETVKEKDTWRGRRRETDYRFFLTQKPVSELTDFERDLLDFLLNTAGTGNEFTMSGVKKTAKKKRTKFRKWFMAWIKQVKEHSKALNFYEPYAVRPMVLNVVVGVAIAAFGILTMVLTDSPAGVPALVLGLVQAILTVTLNRHTKDGRRLALAWRAFHSHLKQTAKARGPATLSSSEWSRYLAAGILFGMHKKLLPQIRMVDDSGHAMHPMWYHTALGSSSGDLSTLADGFSSMVSTMSSTMSSASGTGGGASGGGGGGSGGGGGGAG